MFRSSTKEIGFGSGENQSCRLVVPFQLSLSEANMYKLEIYVYEFNLTELRCPKARMNRRNS
ncbi:Protein argonaute-2 [Gossypium arboreum]|uniref:Protein argonaute-2 n=1 Tax=Gossypium arboreum TaxID=29729 RepID=A0A0B0N9R6_GOSAR|nr:Protein argonaute-2 [Gossypium arboreum]